MDKELCPNDINHTVQPASYLDWHTWAEEMRETHFQIPCEDCNEFAIWIPHLTERYKTVIKALDSGRILAQRVGLRLSLFEAEYLQTLGLPILITRTEHQYIFHGINRDRFSRRAFNLLNWSE